MLTTPSLIRSSWEFFRKQPALVSVGVWLIFFPMLGSDVLGKIAEGDMLPGLVTEEGKVPLIILIALLNILNIWGQCCVLVTGKRMLQTKAGRSRTSFGATASQAKAFIIPFLLTNLLRGCITLLWLIPFFAVYVFAFLIVSIASMREPNESIPVFVLLSLPTIAYLIRTIFTPVIVVGENIGYRAALKRSKDAVKGNFWKITGQLAMIIVILFAIPMGIITAASLPLPEKTAMTYATVSIVSNAWIAVATILVNLCLIQMYEKYRAPLKR